VSSIENNVICEVRGRTAWIRLNRPQALNALTLGIIDSIEQFLTRLEADKTLCALTISGTDRAFSVGADLKELPLRSGGLGYASGPGSFAERLNTLLCRLESFPIPVIAAVRGWALAGGLEIVLACDLVIAGESARFGDAHANYGLLPSGGSSIRLPRRVGATRAREMMFTGEAFSAAQMKEAGLATTVVADAEVEIEAERLASRLASRSPIGLRRMKALLVHSMDDTSAAALRAEQLVWSMHAMSNDMREGWWPFARNASRLSPAIDKPLAAPSGMRNLMTTLASPTPPSIKPFSIDVAESVLTDLRKRLAMTRLPQTPADAGWRYGTSREFMERVIARWLNEYDWRTVERRLNTIPQFTTTIDGYDIHFVYKKGSGPNPKPLILTHGWPGSFVEFEDIIGPLTDPERFGGSASDAFDVVVPSIPGYGWSSAPNAPINTRDVATLWQKLMTDVLGYRQYFAQGGDWGSLVASWLGVDFPGSVNAIHINIMGLRPYTGEGSAPIAPDEAKWLDAARARLRRETGYQAIQGTKPQTLAFGLNDSPAGLAAWIIEKFHGWSESPGGIPPFTLDQLITNVMIYWVTQSIGSSTWLYTASRLRGGMGLAKGERVLTPTGFLACPHDLFPPPPDAWVRRTYNLARRTDLHAGGHFAAYERGDDLVADIRSFFRAYP
jgi:enoyl-CoA hydratase/carnithine racemase/pimeloyl-ACP methyl ester carboxylesterase